MITAIASFIFHYKGQMTTNNIGIFLLCCVLPFGAIGVMIAVRDYIDKNRDGVIYDFNKLIKRD
jgi:hypothetical protein